MAVFTIKLLTARREVIDQGQPTGPPVKAARFYINAEIVETGQFLTAVFDHAPTQAEVRAEVLAQLRDMNPFVPPFARDATFQVTIP